MTTAKPAPAPRIAYPGPCIEDPHLRTLYPAPASRAPDRFRRAGGENITRQGLATALPQVAGPFTEGILAMLATPPGPGTPRKVSAVTIRVVRVTVFGEVTVPVAEGTELFT